MTAGRYTAVFTGLLGLKKPGEYRYMTMGVDPAGNGRGELRRGRPPYGRLGRGIRFEDFPEGFRDTVLEAYRELWGL